MSNTLTCLLIDPREKAYESESESFKERTNGWINRYTTVRRLSGFIHTYKTWFHIDDDPSSKLKEADILINPLVDYMDAEHGEYILDIDNIMYASEAQEKNPNLLCIFTLNSREFNSPLDSEIANIQSEMTRQLPNFKGVYVDESSLNYQSLAKLIDEHLTD